VPLRVCGFGTPFGLQLNIETPQTLEKQGLRYKLLITAFMTSERWEQINRLWDAALELAEEARPAFLESNCQGDQELRREVESVLAYDGRANDFINRPALEVTAEKLASEPPSLVGRKLGPYQILDLLGAGGMGEVYRARDTRLNRTVAIKVLPRHLLKRSDLRQRFEREARAIASLDHPNICALHDVGHEGRDRFSGDAIFGR